MGKGERDGNECGVMAKGEREGKGEREVEHLDLVAREAHEVHHRAAHHWLQRAQHEERVSRRPRRDRQHLDAQPGVDLAVAHALRGAGAGAGAGYEVRGTGAG